MSALSDSILRTKNLAISCDKKKLITLFALLLAVLTVFKILHVFLSEPILSPQDLKISNISENSFTLSWVSQKPNRATAYCSGKPINLPLFLILKVFPRSPKPLIDDFGPILSTTHHVTLKNLKPQTQYYCVVTSGLHLYSLPPIQTTTSLSAIPHPYPCYGTVLDFAEEVPESPIVVYLSTENSSIISSFTNSKGNFTLDLSALRTKDAKESLDLNQNQTLIVEAQGGQWGSNSQPLYIKDCQPIKTIILE
jgi:hypothetical protein